MTLRWASFLILMVICSCPQDGATEEGLSGVRALGVEIEVSSKDRGDESAVIVAIGDTVCVRVTWQVVDRIAPDIRATIRFLSDAGRVSVAQPIGVPVGVSGIGGVFEDEYRIPFVPGYTKLPDLSEPWERFQVELGVRTKGFAEPAAASEGQSLVLSRSSLPKDSICLTANPDAGRAHTQSYVSRVGFTPEPTLHRQATATSPASELTDGVISGTRNFNWECLTWKGVDRATIRVDFDQHVLVDRIVVVSPSPYGNYRIGRVTAGGSDVLAPDGLSGVRFLHVIEHSPSGVEGDSLEIELTRSDDQGVTNFAVCELYIWGRRSP